MYKRQARSVAELCHRPHHGFGAAAEHQIVLFGLEQLSHKAVETEAAAVGGQLDLAAHLGEAVHAVGLIPEAAEVVGLGARFAQLIRQLVQGGGADAAAHQSDPLAHSLGHTEAVAGGANQAQGIAGNEGSQLFGALDVYKRQ